MATVEDDLVQLHTTTCRHQVYRVGGSDRSRTREHGSTEAAEGSVYSSTLGKKQCMNARVTGYQDSIR